MSRRLAVIAAMGTNRVIGKDGQLPWRLPEDLKRFKALTLGHPVIMGRKTHQSIGRPLPGRRNIVVSRQAGLALAGCEVAGSLEAALALLPDDGPLPFVIGGEAIYRAALPLASELLLTLVPAAPEGDVRFPELASGVWEEVERTLGAEGVAFVTLRRAARGTPAPPG
jgi:dihydrofolate reductase